ncbi:MAG: histidinol dehydrogenase [Dysgonamonadaceae bacterium]|nr:histidinol dehydrogenase [Dysgonamonadaceae bacterium]
MKIINNPPRGDWDALASRPHLDNAALFETVGAIIEDVRLRGDAAVLEYEQKFDKVNLSQLLVPEEEKAEAETLVSGELKQAIFAAKANIEKFHAAQTLDIKEIDTAAGVVCWQKQTPIQKVGLYIPGGTAPLFSTVLMLAVPAKIAGCREIVLCSPPAENGKIHPAVLFAAQAAGVDKIFKAGGVQAIAAMACGTESIPRVYKIFGPGNQYVTAAKQLVAMKYAAIDMPAGPSEVEVIADASANPAFVASDLLSQAEHGADSQVILLASTEDVAKSVLVELEGQLSRLPRREIASKALCNSRIIVIPDVRDIIDFTNLYAPEHLIIETENYREIGDKIVNAGSVFLGGLTPESAGDYASGVNHTLPTNGHARAYSGVNLDSFTKKITFQEISQEGINRLGPVIKILAENESLDAHARAVELRMKS